jgi:hypothetical protein
MAYRVDDKLLSLNERAPAITSLEGDEWVERESVKGVFYLERPKRHGLDDAEKSKAGLYYLKKDNTGLQFTIRGSETVPMAAFFPVWGDEPKGLVRDLKRRLGDYWGCEVIGGRNVGEGESEGITVHSVDSPKNRHVEYLKRPAGKKDREVLSFYIKTRYFSPERTIEELAEVAQMGYEAYNRKEK